MSWDSKKLLADCNELGFTDKTDSQTVKTALELIGWDCVGLFSDAIEAQSPGDWDSPWACVLWSELGCT
jgi:hypothetical protein